MADNPSKMSIDTSKDQNFVEEKIDERILRLLGLEDVFDLDYDTYLTLLKEVMVKGRMSKTAIPVEEVMMVTDEFRRVKGKTGRFKVKRGKINVKNIGGSVKRIQASTKKLFLGSTIGNISQDATSEQNKDFYFNIAKIKSVFESIYSSLLNQFKLNKKENENKRKDRENKKRGLSESALEKSIDRIKRITTKLLAPVRGILDKIFNFLYYTFLGTAFTKFVKWANDPKNAEKIKTISRFLKDHWPALLAAYLLFGTTLGRFVRSITGILLKGIARFAMTNPLAAAGVATGALTLGAEMWKQGEENKQIQREAKQRNIKPETVKKELDQAKSSPWAMFGETFSKLGPFGALSGGGRIKRKPNEVNIKDIAFAGGGPIDDSSGLRITGAGPDTQLVAAQPGEIMMSKRAVDMMGANFFLNLNKSAGGTNIPKMVNNIQLAQGGGMIGGMLHNVSKFIGQGTGMVMAPGGKDGNIGYQRKFLGMNIGNRKTLSLTKTYRQRDVDRYNAMRESAGHPDRLVKDMFGRHFSYTDPTPTSYSSPSRPSPSKSSPTRSGPLTRRNITNLMQGYLGTGKGGRVEQMEEILGRKFGTMSHKEYNEYMMKEFGRSTVGEQRKLLLGPQSRAFPTLSPNRKSTPTIINLPPIASSSGPTSQGKTGTMTIPEFSPAQNTAARQLNLATYGIG